MAGSQGSRLAAQNLLLVAGSVVFSLILVALLEFALRLVDLGAADAAGTSRLAYQQIHLPILDPAKRADGVSILRTVDPRLAYQSLLESPPDDAVRILVFGGSATAGLGYSPNASFAKQLERMLEAAYPDRTIEVLNLGIVALAMKQVKLLVAETCRRYRPDLAVVYSGNNEFLEVHAEKYAEANADAFTAIGERLIDTNLYRLINRSVRGDPRERSLAEQNLDGENMRLTQHEIIQDVEMQDEEIAEVVARYEANIRDMVDSAEASRTPILLATVASNWRWRGRSDLPEGWIEDLLRVDGPLGEAEHRRALEILSSQLEEADPSQQWEILYRRAVVHELLEDFAAARRDYRASMNADPHLRRALDSMADAVREVGRDRGVPVLDVIALLAAEAEHGIIGFDEFYDYVHFTPQGAAVVAGGLFRELRELEIVPPPSSAFDAGDYVAQRIAWFRNVEEDPYDLREWIGFGFDPFGIGDRDLWKYDRLVEELDEIVEREPENLAAWVYRGNAAAFRVGGGAQAERSYQVALELERGDGAIRRNLEQILERPAR